MRFTNTQYSTRTVTQCSGYAPVAARLCTQCRSGFARFTNTRYSMKKEDITNTFIHLTNVAIQKHAPGFDAAKVCVRVCVRGVWKGGREGGGGHL